MFIFNDFPDKNGCFANMKKKINIAVHGGAGNLNLEFLGKKEQKGFRDSLLKAIRSGYEILEEGGSAEQAAVKAVSILEDSPYFNAGRGSVLNARKKVSMDAALALGSKEYGAVIGTSCVKNPIRLAQKLLHHCPPNILSGVGADTYAKEHKVTCRPPEYFITEKRLTQLVQDQRQKRVTLDHSNYQNVAAPSKYGTVGAVACDKDGNLAAATSTGGLSNSCFGRVGDSPIIGAGTFADNRTCALSATGIGEIFVKHTAAAQVHYRMLYLKQTLEQAMTSVIHEEMPDACGGFIGLNKEGEFFSTFNTRALFRAYRATSGEFVLAFD